MSLIQFNITYIHAETHRTVLNQILRQTTTHLADGPFSVLVDHTRVLDFDVKRRYFRTELERMDEGIRREELAVHVRRSHVFEDSFRELHRRNADEWKNRFYIVFEGKDFWMFILKKTYTNFSHKQTNNNTYFNPLHERRGRTRRWRFAERVVRHYLKGNLQSDVRSVHS